MSEAKDRYINAISEASDRYGDKLIELMNLYKVGNLSEITEKQAFEFLCKLKNGELRSRESCYFSEGEDFCKALINGNCQKCKYAAVKCVKSSEKKA